MARYPDLSAGVLTKEERRLESVKFVQEASVRKAKTVAAPPLPEMSAAEKTLEEAENLYRDRDLEKAKQAYNRVLRETEDRPKHAAAYYGLARIAVLQNTCRL